MTTATAPRPRRRRIRSREKGLTLPADEIVTTAVVRKMLGHGRKPVTRHTLLRWRSPDTNPYGRPFPEPFRIVDGVELWDAREIRAWIRARDRETQT